MSDELLKETSELEKVVLPKVEAAIREKRPILLNKADALIIRNSFKEAGIDVELSDMEARESLFQGVQFRARVSLGEEKVVTGVEVFDRTKPKGSRWVRFEEMEVDPSAFKGQEDKEEDAAPDKGYGVLEMVGSKFPDLIRFCYEQTAESGYAGRIGKSKKEATRGRGLNQAAASILKIAAINPESERSEQELEEALKSLNRGLLKGLMKQGDSEVGSKSVVVRSFQKSGVEIPKNTVAGFPVDSLPELIRFIAKK